MDAKVIAINTLLLKLLRGTRLVDGLRNKYIERPSSRFLSAELLWRFLDATDELLTYYMLFNAGFIAWLACRFHETIITREELRNLQSATTHPDQRSH